MAKSATAASAGEVLAVEPVIRRVVAARAANTADVDDLVQDCLERLLTARERLAPEAVLPYAIVTARNLVSSHATSAARRTRGAARLLDLNEPDRPEDVVLAGESRRAMTAALDRLSPRSAVTSSPTTATSTWVSLARAARSRARPGRTARIPGCAAGPDVPDPGQTPAGIPAGLPAYRASRARVLPRAAGHLQWRHTPAAGTERGPASTRLRNVCHAERAPGPAEHRHDRYHPAFWPPGLGRGPGTGPPRPRRGDGHGRLGGRGCCGGPRSQRPGAPSSPGSPSQPAAAGRGDNRVVHRRPAGSPGQRRSLHPVHDR